MWDGFWIAGQSARLGAAAAGPAGDRRSATSTSRRVDERADVAQAQRTLQGDSTKKGMVFNKPSIRSRSATRCSAAGFYAEWKEKYGAEAWAVLEK